MLVNMKSSTINAISHFVRFQGADQYQIDTPTKAVMYELDSLPVLNSTTNSNTDASKAYLNPVFLNCLKRK